VKTGIVIFAHGSRIESANEAVRAVAAEMAREGGFELVEAAFLDLAPPDLGEAIRRLVSQGASRVLVIPYFLTLGTHLQRDLPRIVSEAAGGHRDVEILVTAPLDGHQTLSQILVDRAREVLGDSESSG
jgi:sirohydrochlorin ferrochelatase